MSECEICRVGTPNGEKRCSHCGRHVLADELLSDPRLTQIHGELGKALRWQFYRQHSCRLHNFAEAEQLIDWFHARDPEELQALAVAAVVGAGPVEGPWAIEVLHQVSKSIGVSQIEARVFIEDLQARGIVRVDWMPMSTERLGMKPLPRLCWWVACSPSNADTSDGE